jgi:hypothetical protein
VKHAYKMSIFFLSKIEENEKILKNIRQFHVGFLAILRKFSEMLGNRNIASIEEMKRNVYVLEVMGNLEVILQLERERGRDEQELMNDKEVREKKERGL